MQVAIRSFHKYANLATQNKSIQPQLQNQINSNTWLIFALSNLIVGIIMIILSVANFVFNKSYGRDHHQPKKKLPNKSIKDRCRKAMKTKLLLLIPVTTALLQISIVSLSLFTSISLASSPKTPEFRVVGSCQEELCINNNTNKFFKEGDICQLKQFRECTGCPNAECRFHGLSNNGSPGKETRDFLHILNFVGLLLFLPLIEAIGNVVVAKFEVEQQAASSECRTEEEKSLRSNNNQQQQEVKSSESLTKENFLRRKLSDERFHLRLLAPFTFLLHFANSLCSLFLIFHLRLLAPF